MRNFDEDRDFLPEADRSFVLGGHTFKLRQSVMPEVFDGWFEAHPEWSRQQVMAETDRMILSSLEPGQEDAWHAVREGRDAPPVNEGDLIMLLRWVWEQVAGRPTVRLGASENGSGPTGTPSTDDSPSSTDSISPPSPSGAS